MPSQRRPSRGAGLRGRTGPGRVSAPRSARPLGPGEDTGSQARVATTPSGEKRRPRLTGRMAVLILVLAVLVVSYASSLKAYLQQRNDIDTLKTQIAQREKSIDQLQDQKDRWSDPAYLEQQARQQFGYVMPGQTSYVALDANGRQIKPAGTLSDPGSVGATAKPKAWWDVVWSSDVLAGNPPKTAGKPPATKIGSKKIGSDQ